MKKINKKEFVERLAKELNRSEEECILINDILENHFIVGHNNKEKIMKDLVEKMGMTEEEASKVYNICAETIVKGIFRK